MRRFRMAIIFGTGILGKRSQIPGLIFEAASPRISRHRVSAMASMLFVERSARTRPAAISKAVTAASRMCLSRTASGLGIQNERAAHDFVTEIPAEIHGRPHVDFSPSEQPAQFRLDIRKPEEADALLRLELDENVDVAGIRKPARQHGPEQRQLPDAIAPAEAGDLGLGDLDLSYRHALPIMAHAPRKFGEVTLGRGRLGAAGGALAQVTFDERPGLAGERLTRGGSIVD